MGAELLTGKGKSDLKTLGRSWRKKFSGPILPSQVVAWAPKQQRCTDSAKNILAGFVEGGENVLVEVLKKEHAPVFLTEGVDTCLPVKDFQANAKNLSPQLQGLLKSLDAELKKRKVDYRAFKSEDGLDEVEMITNLTDEIDAFVDAYGKLPAEISPDLNLQLHKIYSYFKLLPFYDFGSVKQTVDRPNRKDDPQPAKIHSRPKDQHQVQFVCVQLKHGERLQPSVWSNF